MSEDRSFTRKKPCGGCPFSRACEPGATGGSEPTVFVGQAYGPFMLNCHETPGYEEDKLAPGLPQCAGAAIFRANVDRAKLLPPGLHKLPADAEKVFATPAELVAHHERIPLEVAQLGLSILPPELLLAIEMKKTEVKVLVKPKGGTG